MDGRAHSEGGLKAEGKCRAESVRAQDDGTSGGKRRRCSHHVAARELEEAQNRSTNAHELASATEIVRPRRPNPGAPRARARPHTSAPRSPLRTPTARTQRAPRRHGDARWNVAATRARQRRRDPSLRCVAVMMTRCRVKRELQDDPDGRRRRLNRAQRRRRFVQKNRQQNVRLTMVRLMGQWLGAPA